MASTAEWTQLIRKYLAVTVETSIYIRIMVNGPSHVLHVSFEPHTLA